MSDPIQVAEGVLGDHKELVERLKAPANWLKQPRGVDWKDAVSEYDRAPFEAAAYIERQAAELAQLHEKTGVGITVGGGLLVYGTVEAVSRVGNYIMLDSSHPVEKEDVRRSLARALQEAEAELARKTTVADAYWEIIESFRAENAELRAALKGMISEFVGPYEEGWSSVQRAHRALAAQDGGA